MSKFSKKSTICKIRRTGTVIDREGSIGDIVKQADVVLGQISCLRDNFADIVHVHGANISKFINLVNVLADYLCDVSNYHN